MPKGLLTNDDNPIFVITYLPIPSTSVNYDLALSHPVDVEFEFLKFIIHRVVKKREPAIFFKTHKILVP